MCVYGNLIEIVGTAPLQRDQLFYLRCIRTYAARRRSRIGTMVWRAGWCGSDPELSENVRAGLKAKDRSRHAQTGKPLYKTPYRQVRCGSLRTLLVSINTS